MGRASGNDQEDEEDCEDDPKRAHFAINAPNPPRYAHATTCGSGATCLWMSGLRAKQGMPPLLAHEVRPCLVYGELLDGSGAEVIARGIRQIVGMDFHPVSKVLYFSENQRDWMSEDTPEDKLNRGSGRLR